MRAARRCTNGRLAAPAVPSNLGPPAPGQQPEHDRATEERQLHEPDDTWAGTPEWLIIEAAKQHSSRRAPDRDAHAPGQIRLAGVPRLPPTMGGGCQASDKDRQGRHLKQRGARPDDAAQPCQRAHHDPEHCHAPPAILTIQPGVQSVHATMVRARVRENQISRSGATLLSKVSGLPLRSDFQPD